MNDYQIGKRHGYLGSLVAYPNNANYMRGYHDGYKKAEQEYYQNLNDAECYGGPNDTHHDYFHC